MHETFPRIALLRDRLQQGKPRQKSDTVVFSNPAQRNFHLLEPRLPSRFSFGIRFDRIMQLTHTHLPVPYLGATELFPYLESMTAVEVSVTPL